MGLDGASDDGDGGRYDISGGKTFIVSTVSCSICLDVVSDNGDRSSAKLLCGHRFHLDCIGSAFNMKGVMQCPNCRKIEKGQWLYANTSRPFSEYIMGDWAHDEDLYDPSYSDSTFGLHWCPFGGLTSLHMPLDVGEISSTAYRDLLGQHPIFAEQQPVQSSTHSCPYIAYFGPIHPSSSNSTGSVPEGHNFSHNWNTGPSDLQTSYAFPAMDMHYHSWEHHHSSPFSIAATTRDQPSSLSSGSQRLGRAGSDVLRSGAYVQQFPLRHHGSGPRAGGSVTSTSANPSYPGGSSGRTRSRSHTLQSYYHGRQSSNLSSMRPPLIPRGTTSRHRTSAQVGTSSDQNGSFYFFQPSGPDPDLVPSWAPFHQAPGGAGTGTGSFHHMQH